MKTNLPTLNTDRGLSNWVVTTLRKKILDGEYSPGEKLDQDSIADELNVSRTPIREALKTLASEGFVEILPYHGAYIPSFSKQDIQDVYEVRRIIESEVILQAVPLIPEEGMKRLEGILRQEEESLLDGNEQNYHKADLEFHDLISGYCKNQLLIEILENLNNRILRIRGFALHQSGPHLKMSHEEHKEIYQVMQARDAEKASTLMSDHLKKSAERIKAFIVERPHSAS